MVVAMFIILSIVSCFVASRLDSLSFFLVSMSWLHFKLVKCWSWIVFTDIFYWSQLFRTKNFAARCFYVACVWNILHYYYTMAGAKKSNQYWPKLIWHQANQNGQILPNFSNFIASETVTKFEKKIVGINLTFGVVTLGPIVTSSRLSKDKVVRSEDLTKRSRSDAVHGSWLQVHQDGLSTWRKLDQILQFSVFDLWLNFARRHQDAIHTQTIHFKAQHYRGITDKMIYYCIMNRFGIE